MNDIVDLNRQNPAEDKAPGETLNLLRAGGARKTQKEVVEEALAAALAAHGNNTTKMAAVMGIGRATIYRRYDPHALLRLHGQTSAENEMGAVETLNLLRPDGTRKTVKQIGRETLAAALKAHGGSVIKAASAVCVGRSTLYRRDPESLFSALLDDHPFFSAAQEMTRRLKERGVASRADLAKLLHQKQLYKDFKYTQSVLSAFLTRESYNHPCRMPAIAAHIAGLVDMTPQEAFPPNLYAGGCRPRKSRMNNYSAPAAELPASKPV
ncbi:MAG: helix-turn-helix domain-containing protein [Alphaproteobacteria bacterium]